LKKDRTFPTNWLLTRKNLVTAIGGNETRLINCYQFLTFSANRHLFLTKKGYEIFTYTF
jgi:hypothetical protein